MTKASMRRTEDDPTSRLVGWAQQLGHARHTRDECAARLAQSDEADATHATALSIERWATIVAAIRRLADDYNVGARRLVLNVVEQPGHTAVTVAAGGEGTPYLVAILENMLVCVHARDALGALYETNFRLCPDRDDEATAAYLLQNWMQNL